MVALLRWLLIRQHKTWHPALDARPEQPPPRSSESLRITFVNHATFLLQFEGINILTDPIWSNRASPVSWAGPRRHRPPGIRMSDVPPIDLVLLSHNHYDHLDLPTLRWLAREFRPTIYTGLKVGRLLASQGIGNVVELDWWQEAAARSDLWVTAVPAQHFSGRHPFDVNKTLWCGFVVQSNDLSIYFAGDTGGGPHIDQIAGRFPELDLALLPIGAFRPRWFMGEMHMSPHDAVEAHLRLGARVSVASHFGTFDLADDGKDEPVDLLYEVLRHTNLQGTQFWVLGFGEGRDVPPRRAVSSPRKVAL